MARVSTFETHFWNLVRIGSADSPVNSAIQKLGEEKSREIVRESLTRAIQDCSAQARQVGSEVHESLQCAGDVGIANLTALILLAPLVDLRKAADALP